MKIPVISSLLLLLGIASPLMAIERPKALNEALPEEAPANRAVQVPEPRERANPEAAPAEAVAEAVAPGAWLGVFSQQVDVALAAQLGIDGGVVLRFVAEDSPAAEAGLKVHDVIAAVGGEPLRTQEDLRAAILEHRPGDELKMDVISGGVQKQTAVTLGARPDDIPQLVGPGVANRQLDFRGQLRLLDQLLPNGGQPQGMGEQLKKFEEQLKKMGLQPELMNQQLEQLMRDLPKAEDFKVDIKSAASFTLLDEQGSIEMKMRDGGKEVEVRDKAGELLYDGPWDTPQDKASVDPELRERIERLDFNGGGDGGIKLHFRQNFVLPGEPEEKPEAEPEAEEGEDADAAPKDAE